MRADQDKPSAELVDAVAERPRWGYARSMSKHRPTSWDQRAKARVMSAAAKNPNSPSARDQLNREAQSRADKNEHQRRRNGALAPMNSTPHGVHA